MACAVIHHLNDLSRWSPNDPSRHSYWLNFFNLNFCYVAHSSLLKLCGEVEALGLLMNLDFP